MGTGEAAAAATISTPSTRRPVDPYATTDVRQVAMNLPEHERRTLDRIETGCRAEDPGLADRMDMTAANRPAVGRGDGPRRDLDRAVGAGDRRRNGPRPAFIGAVVAGYGVVLIVAGTVTWLCNRSPGNRTLSGS